MDDAPRDPTEPWSPDELAHLDRAHELEIAAVRGDGALGRWTPIWVVVVGAEAFVRTWYARDTGWYGQVLRSHRARIRVPGLEVDVRVDAVAADGVDDAYRAKYGMGGAGSMTTPEAASTTLLLRKVSIEESR